MLKHGKGIYNLSPATQLKQPSENNQETENIIFFIPPKYLLCGKFYTKTSIDLKPFFFIDDNLRLLSITFDYYRLSFYWLTTPGKYLWVNHICRVHPLSSLVLKVKNNHAHLDPEKKKGFWWRLFTNRASLSVQKNSLLSLPGVTILLSLSSGLSCISVISLKLFLPLCSELFCLWVQYYFCLRQVQNNSWHWVQLLLFSCCWTVWAILSMFLSALDESYGRNRIGYMKGPRTFLMARFRNFRRSSESIL